MATHTSTRGDVALSYNDAWQHPCNAILASGAHCRMPVRNGQHEHCRWHRPARRRVGSIEALLAACGTDAVDKLLDGVILSEEHGS